uniref:Retrovirus-related Pol polyprotein from transposon TNT 1-94 n=1 Tax=Tanacetum cinerariifolium TaxID=118510 RepID=A0A6L2JIY5_TANCI|nr:retrovirus-related Pol polyprotein from transposon TNT 1-94 [Tanacetum cinerariifolium]
MVPPNNLGPDLNSKSITKTQYRGMIGSLMYLTASRPQFSTCLYARYQANPKESHLIAVKIIFRYLKDRKSTLVAYQLLGGKLMCWIAKKHQSIAMSSAEAEYVDVVGCCANILWMKSQLTDYDIIYEKVPIFCYNTSTIAISNNPVLHSRTKHIDIRYHFIRDHILKGDAKLHFIPTQYQLVDIFTKPLDELTFKRLIVELGEVRREIGITTFRNSLRAQYLSHSSMYVPPPIITTEDLIHTLNKKTRKKIVPYPSFISLLLEHMAPKYDNEELTINPTQAIYNLDVPVDSKAPKYSSLTEEETKSSLAIDTSPSHPLPPTPVVGEMHKEAQQAAGGPTSLGDTSKDGAHPQLSSDKTKSAGDGLKTAHTTSSENEESGADDISQKVKLEDLADILKDTRSTFFTPDSPTDEPIIVLNPKLSKLLASHDFASCLPTELKELPLKIIGLSGKIKELKKHIKDVEIELPGDLKEIPLKLETFTSTISSHPRFATLVENASGATTTGVPLANKATASPADGRKDADTNLKNKLVNLLGIDIITRYYNKKLLYERYYEKMKKRR